MELDAQFIFEPLPPLENPIQFPFPGIAHHLGPLAGLAGKWSGQGFNVIWRPDHSPGSNRFLELNLTSELLEFTPISGPIPNRGLLQPDINMFGLTYLQQISDANLRTAGTAHRAGAVGSSPEDQRSQRGPHRGPPGVDPARHGDCGTGHGQHVKRRPQTSRTSASSPSG